MKEVVAGIDIGGTNTVFGLVDRDGNILAEGNIKTSGHPEVEGFVSVLISSIKNLNSNSNDLKITGIGIGAPNANYHKGTIELATNLAWKGIIPFTTLVSREIDLPCVNSDLASC